MKHQHNHCSHGSVKFCNHCNVVYCEHCNQEWTPRWTYPGNWTLAQDYLGSSAKNWISATQGLNSAEAPSSFTSSASHHHHGNE